MKPILLWFALTGVHVLLMPESMAQSTLAPLQAEIVTAAEISTSAVDVTEGQFGRLSVPETGFCEYRFDARGELIIRDSTGEYSAAEATPDGCFAPDNAEPASFELQCAEGDRLEFRIAVQQGVNGVGLQAGLPEAEGGRIKTVGTGFHLFCESETGSVTLRFATSFTFTPDTKTGDGALGTLELQTEY